MFKRSLIFIACCLGPLAAQSSIALVATVDGVNIYEADLQVQSQMAQLQKQEYDAKLRALQNLISRKVLELAAGEKGMTPQRYLAEVENSVPEPTDDELRGFYLARRDQYQRQTFEKVREEVRKAGRTVKIQIATTAMQEAPVTFVEFSDFQCPYCKTVQPTLNAVRNKYGDRISFVHKDFPLSEAHSEAQAAAEAARCAADQGKFWSYYTALFQASPALNKQKLLHLATDTGLDPKAFGACLESAKHRSEVQAERAEGEALGVVGTPFFFINGVNLGGAVRVEEFAKIIDAELAGKR